ncbi:hypothetical protein [Streptomyces mirabilis]|uniref:hypothetical protein n=1 Tax=Streptomyces mirabilis TaxID=68239 RepID=UPI0037FD5C10
MASAPHAPDARETDQQSPTPALVQEKREDTVPKPPVPGLATPFRPPRPSGILEPRPPTGPRRPTRPRAPSRVLGKPR